MITRKQLERWFGNERSYHIKNDYFPNGRERNDCFGWAVHIANRLPGHARIYHIDESNMHHNLDAEEHYFAVVDDKWIVDPWLSLFMEETPSTVMDVDSSEAEYWYGPRKYWKNHYGNRKDWSSFGEGPVKPKYKVVPKPHQKSATPPTSMRKMS